MAGNPNTTGKKECFNMLELSPRNKSQNLTAWIGDWKSRLTSAPDPALVAAAQDILLIAADEASANLKKGEEFHIRKELVPVLDHLLCAVARLVRGDKFRDIEHDTGVSWTRLRACAGVDKRGFGVVWEVAMRLRDEDRAERAQELLRQKAEDGIQKAVTVRRGEDYDEIEMVTVDSESLIAKAADIATRARAEKIETKNTTNIGQAITYNIEAPQFILNNEPLKLIETNPLEGLKKSLE